MFIILILVIYLAFFFTSAKPRKESPIINDPKYASQMKKLWNIAQTSMRERKPLRAEKALLTILKFDEKNAAAYNRLGILYAKAQKYDEAIECFEIAQSLDNNASSLHNAGLIYLETGAYEKASMAFQQALKLEGDLPARYIALAKAEEKLGHRKSAIEALEGAFELDHSLTTLRQILALHEAAEDAEAITATTARIEALIAENTAARQAKQRTKAVKAQPQPAARNANTGRTGRRAARILTPANLSNPPRTRALRTTSTAAQKTATKPNTTRSKSSTPVRTTPRKVRTPNSVMLGTPKRSVKNTANLGKAARKATRITVKKKIS